MSEQHRLHFQELYLELSYLCTAECSHCYVSSSPHADRTRLDTDLACRAIEESLSINEISPQVAIAGGEPTIFWDDLLTIIRFASQRGLRVLLISNGWWGRSLKTCREKLDALIEHGLTRLEISTSAYHRQFVDSAAVNNIILAGRGRPIELALHVRFSTSCGVEMNLAPFEGLDEVELIRAPVMPVGRAATAIPADEFSFAEGFPRGSCQDDLSLLINPKGDCFPCCGGSELSDHLRLGNIAEESLKDILLRAEERKLLPCLTEKGPTFIAQALRADGFKELIPGNYVNICDLCSSIFNVPRLATAAERWVNSPASRKPAVLEEPAAEAPRPLPSMPTARSPLVGIQPRSRPAAPRPTESEWDAGASPPLTPGLIPDLLAQLSDGSNRGDALKPFTPSEPSGASVFMVGDYYLKTARGEAGIKLKAQAEWLSYVRSQGVSCVPKVVALHTDDTGLVSYLMRGYRINSPGADYGPTEMTSEVLGRLETIWQVPAPTPTPPNWPGYIGRVGSLLARYDERAAGLLTETGQRVYELNRARVKGYTVHGDPTFENVVYDEDGELILLDPNPQTPPHVCLPELDAAKVLQSAFGWESFVYRRSAALRVDTALRPLIQSRFGPDGWPTCLWLLATHLVRTLPYGAKVDDGTRLLPSIRGVLDHLSGLMGSG